MFSSIPVQSVNLYKGYSFLYNYAKRCVQNCSRRIFEFTLWTMSSICASLSFSRASAAMEPPLQRTRFNWLR